MTLAEAYANRRAGRTDCDLQARGRRAQLGLPLCGVQVVPPFALLSLGYTGGPGIPFMAQSESACEIRLACKSCIASMDSDRERS
jgi:hypothetical protein